MTSAGEENPNTQWSFKTYNNRENRETGGSTIHGNLWMSVVSKFFYCVIGWEWLEFKKMRKPLLRKHFLPIAACIPIMQSSPTSYGFEVYEWGYLYKPQNNNLWLPYLIWHELSTWEFIKSVLEWNINLSKTTKLTSRASFNHERHCNCLIFYDVLYQDIQRFIVRYKIDKAS